MATSPRVLDLTTLDREVVEPGYEREKFAIKIGSEEENLVIEFTDPQELPWDVVVTMDQTPRRFFSVAVEDDDQKRFILRLDKDKALKLWQMRYIMEQYRAHFGIDAEGNAVASRRS